MDGPVVGYARGAEGERALVPVGLVDREALGRGVVIIAAVQERLVEAIRGLVQEIVRELHVSPERLRDPGVERVEAVAVRLLLQQVEELTDRPGELDEAPLFSQRAVPQPLDADRPILGIVDERSALHLRILRRIGMELGRLEVRIHDPQVAPHHVHGEGRRGDQLGPCIPALDDGLGDHVSLQIDRIVGPHDRLLGRCDAVDAFNRSPRMRTPLSRVGRVAGRVPFRRAGRDPAARCPTRPKHGTRPTDVTPTRPRTARRGRPGPSPGRRTVPAARSPRRRASAARSPVAYIRAPGGPYGSGRNRSAVRLGSPT